MRRTVVLHGYLSSFHEGPIEVTGNTVAEIIELVTRQLPGFAPHPVIGRHRIKIVGFETEADLYRALDDTAELHVVPQFNGGKDGGGWTQVLLGAALVGVGFALSAVPGGQFFGSMAIKAGALVLLGGLGQLLAPAPEADKDNSRYLSSPKNTVQIGTRIPILYGEYRVYGQFLSFDINAKEIKGSAASGGSGASK